MNNYFNTVKKNWSNIITKIKENADVSDVAFKTWLLPLEPVSFDFNTLTIYHPDPSALDVVVKKYNSNFNVVLSELLNIECEIKCTNKKKEGLNFEDINIFKDNNLNPKYTFDTFVKGSNNEMAYAASLNIANSPAQSYNPLFLYANPGLGKTHLMNAIGHMILKNNPTMKVVYVTSEEFTNELISSIRRASGTSGTNIDFRNKYRNIDVLLIDDIQFIIGKESTQEEFFHTFNALQSANKQIVISSDKPPKDFITLEDRLKSRFQSGLVVDINPPNYETRMAILKMYQDIKHVYFNDDILVYIALKIETNIRELEGAFNTLIAHSQLLGNDNNITLEQAKEMLSHIITPNDSNQITPTIIMDIVCEHYKIDINELKGKSRSKKVTGPRHVFMYLCDKLIDMPLKDIGKTIGGRDHSTIINGRDKILNEISKNKNFEREINSLINKIKTM